MFKTKLTILSIAIAALFSTSSAQAGHKCYKYTGTCHKFAGEAHMIEALLHLDNAYYANCYHDRRRAIAAAKSQIIFALQDICCGRAKRELILALGPMSQYAYHPDECLLDDASAHILTAMQLEHAETLIHHAPIVQPTAIHTRVHHVFHDDFHHHRHRPPQPASVSFGGKGWRIRIGF